MRHARAARFLHSWGRGNDVLIITRQADTIKVRKSARRALLPYCPHHRRRALSTHLQSSRLDASAAATKPSAHRNGDFAQPSPQRLPLLAVAVSQVAASELRKSGKLHAIYTAPISLSFANESITEPTIYAPLLRVEALRFSRSTGAG